MTARRTAFLWLFAFACWTVSGCGIGVQANGNGQISVKIDAGVPAGGPAAPTGTANRPVGANPGFNPGGNPAAPDGGTLAKGDTNDVTGAIGPRAPSATAGGSAQGDHIVQVANNYVGADFPYAAATNGGRKGCAQVVSTILKEAGALPNVSLGVLQVKQDLKGQGWGSVRPPPWKNGDVVTWATYDRDGDGRIDDDTHVGIVEVVNGEPYAIANSSSKRTPVKFEMASVNWRVSDVLRKES